MPSSTYLHGCNYPWSSDGSTIFYGLDFGASVWGSHVGVSTRRAAAAHDFAGMAALGFTTTRWFLFCDGRAGIVYDDRGLPIGPDPHLFADLDTALEIARDTAIRVDFVLFDYRWMFAGLRDAIFDQVTGAMLATRLPEGRAPVLLSPFGRDRLFDRVLVPLVRRYGPAGERADLASALLAVELMNAPDVVIEEWERDLSAHVRRPLPFAVVAELVSRLSDVVHEHSSAFATIGCSRVHNLLAWDAESLGLDVLQVHSYPDPRHPERDAGVFGTPASRLGVRRDVILGAFPGGGPSPGSGGAPPSLHTLDEYLELADTCGYAGAWPWSFSGTDTYGKLPVEPLRRFAARHPELVHPRAATARAKGR